MEETPHVPLVFERQNILSSSSGTRPVMHSDSFAFPNAVAAHAVVVVVDDDAALRDVICKALQRAGYETCGQSNAKDAMESLSARKTPPTILLTDLVLSGGEGGWALAQQVRQSFPLIPIVFMSGYIDEPVVHAMIEQGKISFLSKPFEIRGLLDCLRSLTSE